MKQIFFQESAVSYDPVNAKEMAKHLLATQVKDFLFQLTYQGFNINTEISFSDKVINGNKAFFNKAKPWEVTCSIKISYKRQ